MALAQFIKVPDLPHQAAPVATDQVFIVHQGHVQLTEANKIFSPVGPDKAVQFNDAGEFGGNDGCTFSGNTLTVKTPGGGVGHVVIGEPSSTPANLNVSGDVYIERDDGNELMRLRRNGGSGTEAELYTPLADGLNLTAQNGNVKVRANLGGGSFGMNVRAPGGADTVFDLIYGGFTMHLMARGDGWVSLDGVNGFQVRDNANTAMQFGVDNAGLIRSNQKVAGVTVPWFLPIYDVAGVLIGYTPLYPAVF